MGEVTQVVFSCDFLVGGNHLSMKKIIWKFHSGNRVKQWFEGVFGSLVHLLHSQIRRVVWQSCTVLSEQRVLCSNRQAKSGIEASEKGSRG
jgi:hypothetical protein